VTGTRLGHYEITARLGAGGMGEVHRTTDTEAGGASGQSLVSPEISRQRSETPSSAAHRST
jgi:hypothetical protein